MRSMLAHSLLIFSDYEVSQLPLLCANEILPIHMSFNSCILCHYTWQNKKEIIDFTHIFMPNTRNYWGIFSILHNIPQKKEYYFSSEYLEVFTSGGSSLLVYKFTKSGWRRQKWGSGQNGAGWLPKESLYQKWGLGLGAGGLANKPLHQKQ